MRRLIWKGPRLLERVGGAGALGKDPYRGIVLFGLIEIRWRVKELR